MRFHVVGLPFKPTPECAYHGKVERFATMMRERGHEVAEYHAKPSEWDPERRFDPSSRSWRAMNKRVARAIEATAEPEDFLCLIGGLCQKAIALRLPGMMAVEFGVGYGGVFAPYRIFESYAWMHTVYGASGQNPHGTDGRWYDAVIPNYYDPKDFPAGKGDGGFLFMGRLIQRKGVSIAAEVCQHLGEELLIAGVGPEPPEYGTQLGLVDHKRRGELMGAAKAVFVPTIYVEPFGGVAAEAMLCGTPVITTDWGAFTETVIDGVTGFRCRTFAEFVDAAREAPKLDRARIREHALSRWTYDAVAPQYERHFARLGDLWRAGWYELPEETTVNA